MPPQLVALDDSPSISLDKPIVLIGRHQECDVQVPSRKISRRHCCIAQVANYLVVRDLGSTNGIRINGTRVLEGRLAVGDELVIGNLHYQVRWHEQMVAAGRPRAAERPPVVRPVERVEESCEQPLPLPESSDPAIVPRAQPVGWQQMVTAEPPRPPLPAPPPDSGSHVKP